MPIVPLYGHEDLRSRLADAFSRGTLPSTLLFEGNRGVGKQRLALWLGQLLLCERPGKAPCGACSACRYVVELQHPDLHWYFPRPRPRDSDPDLEDVRLDIGETIAERAAAHGLYAPPSGMDGVFVATTRLIVRQAALSPALAKRKIFIVGDAERMVPQEGKDEAANAFLKLLEEPPANTTIVLTSSEPGALLPTVRSRVASIRVGPVALADVESFLSDDAVVDRLDRDEGVADAHSKRVTFAAGAPGRLLAGESLNEAQRVARRMLEAASGRADARYDTAWVTSSTKARGGFADTLDALTVELHARAEGSIKRGAHTDAFAASRAIDAVEVAKERILTNVSPQLITVNLLRELRELLS
jgi:DNA polymerase III subunit delta'